MHRVQRQYHLEGGRFLGEDDEAHLSALFAQLAASRILCLADMTDVEIVVEALDCAGLLPQAGGLDAVLALTADRPALEAALAAGREAVARIEPIGEETVVLLAAALLGGE